MKQGRYIGEVNSRINTLLQLLELDGKSALMTSLSSYAIVAGLCGTKGMSMLCVFPPLPDSLLGSLSQILEALFKLLVLLLFLLGYASFIFGVQCFGGAPFLPGKLFHLISEEKHHVRVGGFVWIGL